MWVCLFLRYPFWFGHLGFHILFSDQLACLRRSFIRAMTKLRVTLGQWVPASPGDGEAQLEARGLKGSRARGLEGSRARGIGLCLVT